jgi:hypothetical protein
MVEGLIQPCADSVSDSKPGLVMSTVERLNESPGTPHTHQNDDTAKGEQAEGQTQADRVYAFALAEALDFPRVALTAAESVSGDRESWHKFTAFASPERLGKALSALESLANPSGTDGAEQ